MKIISGILLLVVLVKSNKLLQHAQNSQGQVTYECSLNSRHHTLANFEFTWSGPPGLTFDLAHTRGDASDGVCSRAHNDCMRRFNRLAGAVVASNGQCVRGLNCDGVPDSDLHEYYRNFVCVPKVTYKCSLNSRHNTLADHVFTWSGPPGLTFDLAHTTGDASDGVCSRAHNDCMRRFNRLAGAVVASNGECVRGLNCDGVPDSALHEYYQNFQCAKVYTTSKPTFAPSAAPTTSKPTFAPSDVPTTSNPTSYPSVAPTTSNPTFYPSVAPTQRYHLAPYKMSRPEGLAWCADQGMGLVAPQNDEDIAEIQNLGLTHFIWLAIERDESNPSRWINTYSKEPLTYTNWNGAEGNNRGERFAIMRFDSGFSGRWFDWGNKHLKYDIVCDSEPRANSIFSAASEEDCIHEIFDIGRVFGTEAHTIHVKLDLPEYSDPRQWILNLGQESTGANHWIWRGETVQFGSWNGPQIRKVDINSCTDLTTTFDGKNTLTLYCNGKFLGQIENSNLHIRNSNLAVAGNQRKEVPQGNFGGCVHYVEVWDYDLSSREVASLTKYAPKEQLVGY